MPAPRRQPDAPATIGRHVERHLAFLQRLVELHRPAEEDHVVLLRAAVVGQIVDPAVLQILTHLPADLRAVLARVTLLEVDPALLADLGDLFTAGRKRPQHVPGAEAGGRVGEGQLVLHALPLQNRLPACDQRGLPGVFADVLRLLGRLADRLPPGKLLGRGDDHVVLLAEHLQLDVGRGPVRRRRLGRLARLDGIGPPDLELYPVDLAGQQRAALRVDEPGVEAAPVGPEDRLAGGQLRRVAEGGPLARLPAVVEEADLEVLVRPGVDVEAEHPDLLDRLGLTEIEGHQRRLPVDKHPALAAPLAGQPVDEHPRAGHRGRAVGSDADVAPGQQVAAVKLPDPLAELLERRVGVLPGLAGHHHFAGEGRNRHRHQKSYCEDLRTGRSACPHRRSP